MSEKSIAIAMKLEERFVEEFRFHPADGEVRSWTNSLGAMAGIVDGARLHDHGVLVIEGIRVSRAARTLATRNAIDQELIQSDFGCSIHHCFHRREIYVVR